MKRQQKEGAINKAAVMGSKQINYINELMCLLRCGLKAKNGEKKMGDLS